MKIDILLIPVGGRYADMRAAALAAEEAGFDGLWTWDHLRDPDERAEAGVPEVWTTLTALAEVTRRLTLGRLVLTPGSAIPAFSPTWRPRCSRSRAGACSWAWAPAPPARWPTRESRRRSTWRSPRTACAPSAWPRPRRCSAACGPGTNRASWARSSGSIDRRGSCDRIRRRPSSWRASARAWPHRGAHGDGFNTQPCTRILAELARVAREATPPPAVIAAIQRERLAGLSERWLRAGTPERARPSGRWARRLILLASPPYTAPASACGSSKGQAIALRG